MLFEKDSKKQNKLPKLSQKFEQFHHMITAY